MTQFIKKRFFKTIFWFGLVIIFLFFSLVAALQIPYVQNKVIAYVSLQLTKTTGFFTTIDYVEINWFDWMTAEGVKVYDPENNLMIEVKDLELDFYLPALLKKSTKKLDAARLKDATVYFTRIPWQDSLQKINIDVFIKSIRKNFGDNNQRNVFRIGEITMENGTFRYHHPDRDSLSGRFDQNHFVIEHIDIKMSEVTVFSDTVECHITQLTGIDSVTSLEIANLSTRFRVSQKAMEFRALNLKTPKSHIKDSVIFYYNGTAALGNFVNLVDIKAHLNQSIIHTDDLAHFAPDLKNLNDEYVFSGDFNGKINRFRFSDFHLKLGNRSDLHGSISMTGLPNLDETFIDFNLQNSSVDTRDLKDYLRPSAYKTVAPLERIGFSANFLGFPNDFVADGEFNSSYGRLISDINLKIAENVEETTFSGNITMYDFDLGRYSGLENTFQKVGVHGKIKGRGLTFETADFTLNGNVNYIGIKGYNYENIITNARFAKEFFQGYLSIDDPNLRLKANGSVDLRNNRNLFNLEARLDTANLKALNLSDRDIFVSSIFDVDGSGLQIDSIVGVASFKNTFIGVEDQSLYIDSLYINSKKSKQNRSLNMVSERVNIEVAGNFDYTTIYRDLLVLAHEYRLNLENDQEAIVAYYNNKSNDFQDYAVQLTMDLADLNPLVQLFLPDFSVSSGVKVEGNFTNGYTSIFDISAEFDSLRYQKYLFSDNEFQLNTSKISDSKDVLAMLYVYSEKQVLGKLQSKELALESIWNNNHIDFEFDIAHRIYDNWARLEGDLDFLPGRTRIGLKPSDIQALDKIWTISQDNEINILPGEIEFSNLVMSNDRERISINGLLSKVPEKSLSIQFDSLGLDNINPLIEKDLDGIVDGDIEISDYYGDRKIENQLVIKDFTLNNFLVGNVIGDNFWDHESRRFVLNFSIDRLGERIVNLMGFYTPKDRQNPLDLNARLSHANLKILEPFIEPHFSEVGGLATGGFAIRGTLNRPEIFGEGNIDDAAVKVNYLNALYRYSGDFAFDGNRILLKDIQIQDELRGRGVLNGHFSHQGLKNIFVNLRADFTNFQVLNTTANDNSLFYGTGFTSGNVRFLGPLRNMIVKARARTEKGTRIAIPIGGIGTIEQEEFIQFVDFNDTTTTLAIDKLDKVDLKGLNLDFDLEITPEAYCEIIFDIKSGDIIRGRGQGDLNLIVDPNGEFNMFGDFEIQEGGYNFTLYNIINKEFQILPKSKISWYGDPYAGIMDIQATYSQLASLLPLFQTQESDTIYADVPELKRKYPTKVFLDLKGPLLSPSINFDISVDNLPFTVVTSQGETIDMRLRLNQFKNSMDEQELKRQVFSLVILRRFSPPESFNAGGALASSVSELLSNQLSYWITQVDDNLEIDIDLGKLDDEALNTFQLRLSYTFLEGRLRVTRDGGITSQVPNSAVPGFIGDWTVEYLLTPDGKLRVKMYNRTNYNVINSNITNQSNVTTGFSILYTQSFNELKDLFRKAKETKGKTPPNESVRRPEGVIEEDENY